MKETVSRKEDAHQVLCQNSAEEIKRRYKRMKNKAKKTVSKVVKEKTDEALTELQNDKMGCLD